MKMVLVILRALFMFVLPTKLVRVVFSKFPRVGFSIVLVDDFSMINSSSIGHINLIRINKLQMSGARIGHLNIIKGGFDLVMNEGSRILNSNKISSSTVRRYERNRLTMSDRATIGTSHLIDMTSNVYIGKGSMIAGADTQIWTHSYLFLTNDNRQVRIDGDVTIGDNVYVAARNTICPGISIVNNVMTGAGTCISKNLDKEGLYVSSQLKYIDANADSVLTKYSEHIVRDGIYKK